MDITTGLIKRAQKIVLYGPEGIGKSTFAYYFPKAVFIDTEGGTANLDVARTPKPTSWTMLMDQVRYFINNPSDFDTVVIDTIDWTEMLCVSHICEKSNHGGIEDFGYGKGHVYLAEEFRNLLRLLDSLIDRGINILLLAHAQMRKFEEPNEIGAYDRWELKLSKKTAPLVKEWADMLLFANYEINVINVDKQGAQKGKNKAQGGKRVMYTSHHPCWDAKNRHYLEEKYDLDPSPIVELLTSRDELNCDNKACEAAPETAEPLAPPTDDDFNKMLANEKAGIKAPVTASNKARDPDAQPVQDGFPPKAEDIDDCTNVPKDLFKLMGSNGVTTKEIQAAVASKGYFPINTPIENYPYDFVDGVLVGAWQKVYELILDMRENNKEAV